MTNIEWTVENEIQLFYAMMNHKPVGINKHFQMMAIHDNFSSSLNCEISSEEIWKKLGTLYDLQALDDSDKLPFPNNEEEFCLPQEAFSNLLEERLHQCIEETNEESKRHMHYIKRNLEDSSATPDDDERDTPRRSLKRGRESTPKHSSPASTKRRR